MKKILVLIIVGLMMVGISGQIVMAAPPATDLACNGCVNDTDVATSAITESKIGTSVVTTTKIADGAVTDAKILDSSVSTGKIADGAVTSSKVADGAITNSKIVGPISASKVEKLANVVVVAKSGGNFTSIQTAVDSINPSVENPFLIKVMPGTYVENIIMKSYVHLQGAGYDITTIQSPSPSSNVITLIDLVDVAISDMSIIGGNYGISNTNSSPTISRNKITGNYIGIFHWGCSSRIINNIISNNVIGTQTVAGAPTIIQNTITGNSEWGIWEQSGGSATIKGNIISGNGNGITVSNSSSPKISENTITDNISKGIDIYVASPTIYRNTITSNGGIGINALGASLIISFNVYDTIQVIGSYGCDSGPVNVVGMYNVKTDGSPAPLQ